MKSKELEKAIRLLREVGRGISAGRKLMLARHFRQGDAYLSRAVHQLAYALQLLKKMKK
jgi:hypothetical protein